MTVVKIIIEFQQNLSGLTDHVVASSLSKRHAHRGEHLDPARKQAFIDKNKCK